MSVEKTNTGTTYNIQDDGSKVIASTRRPDGTLRKPIRVRAGYTPLEENLYKGPDVQQKAKSGFPPGFQPDEPAKAQQKKPKEKKEPKPKEPTPPATSKAAHKEPEAPVAEAAAPAAPEKRLRNLRKKLLDISNLEERAANDGVDALTPEQREKVARRAEVEAEVQEIEKQLAALQL